MLGLETSFYYHGAEVTYWFNVLDDFFEYYMAIQVWILDEHEFYVVLFTILQYNGFRLCYDSFAPQLFNLDRVHSKSVIQYLVGMLPQQRRG